jgi:hypothetical protein
LLNTISFAVSRFLACLQGPAAELLVSRYAAPLAENLVNCSTKTSANASSAL